MKNVVERRISENHFEGIEHRVAGQSLRLCTGCSGVNVLRLPNLLGIPKPFKIYRRLD